MDEDTKPQPPSSLLPAGHEWRVVEAAYWTAEHYGGCTFNVGMDGYHGCGASSVALEREPKKARYGRQTVGLLARCEKHLGSIRWISDGKVLAWRAEVC